LKSQLAEWKILLGWGGTPQIIEDWIKGQQDRIHAAQYCEEENAKLREALKPFAEMATQGALAFGDNERLLKGVYVGDLRRAKAAMKEGE
jgi:hypothetical protein